MDKFLCRNHILLVSFFMHCHCFCNKSKTISIVSGTGTSYPLGAPELIPGFILWIDVAQYLVLCVLRMSSLSFILMSANEK